MLSRVLEFSRAGEAFRASVDIGAPEFEQGVWRCRWRMDVLHPEGLSMTGEDALDAFLRSLRFVSKFLRGCEEDGWQVKWQNVGDHGGFPLVEPL